MTRSGNRFGRPAGLALSAASLLAAVAVAALAGDELPKPPDTPLPTFENPLHDAKVGETLRYLVKDYPDGAWTRYFEETVLAVDKEMTLLETVETNRTGDKTWNIDPERSGWRYSTETIKIPEGANWKKDRQKEEILYIGTPPTKAVRCTHRVLDEQKIPGDEDSGRKLHEIWYSHDVPASGKVKEYPAASNGERYAVSWDKTVPAEACAERAKKYGPVPKDDKPTFSTPQVPPGGMDEPAMDPPMDGGEGMGG